MERNPRGRIRPGVGKQVYRVSRAGHGADERGEIAFRTTGGCISLADEGDSHARCSAAIAAPSPVRAIPKTSSTVIASAQVG